MRVFVAAVAAIPMMMFMAATAAFLVMMFRGRSCSFPRGAWIDGPHPSWCSWFKGSPPFYMYKLENHRSMFQIAQAGRRKGAAYRSLSPTTPAFEQS
jgi:hypothetical protein